MISESANKFPFRGATHVAFTRFLFIFSATPSRSFDRNLFDSLFCTEGFFLTNEISRRCVRHFFLFYIFVLFLEGTVYHRKAAATAVNDEKRGEKFAQRKLNKEAAVTVCLLVCERLEFVA